MAGMRVAVAMSGGVDSSVAAYLLREQGYEVHGFHMVHAAAAGDRGRRSCCAVEDATDARGVARQLGIPLRTLNFRREFRGLQEEFVDAYLEGRTPNPCIRCNQGFKFGKLLRFARSIGARAVATGHYARLDQIDGRRVLRRGVDRAKDQSYVLFGLDSSQLAWSLFPLGALTKGEVRDLARKAGIPVAEKAESMDVCFLDRGGVRGLIETLRPGRIQPGEIVDGSGRAVARHAGAALYTVGQRKGLGGGWPEPRYVVATDPETNRVVIGTREQARRDRCAVENVRWGDRVPPGRGESVSCAVQVRARSQARPARVRCTGAHRAQVRFAHPVFAVTPGQAAVWYEGDRVLGGGWITRDDAPDTPPDGGGGARG